MRQTTVVGASWRFALFAAAMITLLVLIAATITRPTPGDGIEYHAEFTDVSGLKTGDDVRMVGVQVGKVTDIELRGSVARVGFSADQAHPIHDNSVLAVRYQSLAGQRYLDIRQPDKSGNTVPHGTTFDLEHTIPSFDMTQLFNGLQPVLTEFSPDALNRFAENVLAVIQGDGNGIGPALEAFATLSDYVSDRQTVLSAIVTNLHDISEQLGGRSTHLITLVQGLTDVFTTFRQQLDGVIHFAAVAPSALEPLNGILATLGFTENSNTDLINALRLLFPDPDQAMALLGKLPGLIQSLANTLPPAGGTASQVVRTCTRGPADVPAPLSVLIAGQQVSVCK